MTVIKKPEILLPKNNFEKWSVIACDQFTSEPAYWNELEKFVGAEKSALNVIFPEIYLGKDDEKRIAKINATMDEYLKSPGFFREINDYILVERTRCGRTRYGIMMEIDLEKYDFTPFADVPIKATEATVPERIPPRVKIRQNATLELPHVMLLADDKEGDLFQKVVENKRNYEVVYDFDLNMGGGHLKGYKISDAKLVEDGVAELGDGRKKLKKYGKKTEFLFAVGDGNHSLATAKKCWDLKKENLTASEKESDPARFALVELVNLYDEGLIFEPIHRVVYGASAKFLQGLKSFVGKTEIKTVGCESFSLDGGAAEIIAKVQNCIESAKANGEIEGVDYVHGEDSLKSVVAEHKNSVGIILPSMKKDELFPFVLSNGVLPKKTFSMGVAREKRYYTEARKIK